MDVTMHSGNGRAGRTGRGRAPSLRVLMALVAASMVATLSCKEELVRPDDAAISAVIEALVSNPVATPGAGGLAGAGLSDVTVAYLSLPPGSVPDGVDITIRNRRTGVSVAAVMVDGGFDPVPVPALAGDTLDLNIRLAGGGVMSLGIMAPVSRRPRVVRTDPPPRKRNVPLNASILVVFTEPMDAETLAAGVRLFRGNVPIAGEIEMADPAGLSVRFTPAQPLAFAADHRLVISGAVRDLDGDAMDEELAVEFTTEPVASVMAVPAVATLVIGDTLTVALHAFDQDGNRRPDPAASWRAADTKVVHITPAGVVTGVGAGESPVWPGSDWLSGDWPHASASIAVVPPPTLHETEPNGAPETANDVVLGDVVAGTLDALGDEDYFAVDLSPGTLFEVELLNPWSGYCYSRQIVVFAPDGAQVASNWGGGVGAENVVIHLVTEPGRHVVLLSGRPCAFPMVMPYSLRFGAREPGPADPPGVLMTVTEEMVGWYRMAPSIYAMAGGRDGDLYLVPACNSRYPGGVLRIDTNGGTTFFRLSDDDCVIDVVVDGFGTVLASMHRWLGDGPESGRILRVTDAGDATELAAGLKPLNMTVGPDGDVWVVTSVSIPNGDALPDVLVRMSPDGQVRSSITLNGEVLGLNVCAGCEPWVTDLEFSPAGRLHLLLGNNVVGWTGTGFEPVIRLEAARVSTSSRLYEPDWGGGLAFDEAGNLYVTVFGAVQMFDAHYNRVHNRLMTLPHGSTDMPLPGPLRFRSGAGGVMTSTLVAVDGSGDGRLFFGSSPGPPGHRPGAIFTALDNQTLAAGTVGEPYADTLRMAEPAGPASWSVAAGHLPPGLTLDGATGVLHGTPTAAGRYDITVRGVAGGRTALWPFSLMVGSP